MTCFILRACPVFYLQFLEEILLKKSWKTGKVLRWLDILNFNRSSRRNIFSWFLRYKKEVFIFRYMFGRVTRYEYFSTANYRFVLQLFKAHLFSEDTYRPPIELSEPPSKLSRFSKNWDNLFGGSLKFNRRSICVFREKMRLEKL